jgi:hypothetical protein
MHPIKSACITPGILLTLGRLEDSAIALYALVSGLNLRPRKMCEKRPVSSLYSISVIGTGQVSEIPVHKLSSHLSLGDVDKVL